MIGLRPIGAGSAEQWMYEAVLGAELRHAVHVGLDAGPAAFLANALCSSAREGRGFLPIWGYAVA